TPESRNPRRRENIADRLRAERRELLAAPVRSLCAALALAGAASRRCARPLLDRPPHAGRKRRRERSRAFCASTVRSRRGALVASDANNARAAAATSSTAPLNGASFASDGLL